MLISEFVEAKWTHKTKKYYQNKDYVFTKYNDTFTVSVKDLSRGCSLNVIVKCDYCKEDYDISYHKYNNLNKSNNTKDACDNCKHLKVSEIARFKSMNKITISKEILINDIDINHMINIDDVNKCGVYIIINTYNNKYYIGSTINLYARMKNHLKELHENNHHSIHLQRSWNKYGKNNFSFGVLEYVDNIDVLIEREQYWLDKLHAYNDEYGYNICKKAYSCLGVKHGERSQEVKDKISKANKGRIRNDVAGSNNNFAKLNEKIVTEIKLRIFNGEFIPDIKNDYDIEQSSLYGIINGTLWKHVLPELNISNCKNLMPHAKLTEKEVLKIREKLLNDVDIKDLAREYCISVETIRDIKTYRTWKNIKPLEEVI